MFKSLKQKTFYSALPLLVGGGMLMAAHQAAAFCFSNDSLSNTSMEVRQIETGPFLSSLQKGARHNLQGAVVG